MHAIRRGAGFRTRPGSVRAGLGPETIESETIGFPRSRISGCVLFYSHRVWLESRVSGVDGPDPRLTSQTGPGRKARSPDVFVRRFAAAASTQGDYAFVPAPWSKLRRNVRQAVKLIRGGGLLPRRPRIEALRRLLTRRRMPADRFSIQGRTIGCVAESAGRRRPAIAKAFPEIVCRGFCGSKSPRRRNAGTAGRERRVYVSAWPDGRGRCVKQAGP